MSWDYRVDGSVVVWDLTGFTDPSADDYDRLLDRYEAELARSGVTGTVVHMHDRDEVSGVTFDFLQAFVSVTEAVGVDRVACVSEGDAKVAVFGGIHDADFDTHVGEDLDEAVAWARGSMGAAAPSEELAERSQTD
ncbi:hypothetical protein [Halobaculum sp. P14]|uniref:hypothetical protein n=1 Tax=Halobaculum sp. P14 TaxID=3421638 RepID=UPI003EB8BD0D